MLVLAPSLSGGQHQHEAPEHRRHPASTELSHRFKYIFDVDVPVPETPSLSDGNTLTYCTQPNMTTTTKITSSSTGKENNTLVHTVEV